MASDYRQTNPRQDQRGFTNPRQERIRRDMEASRLVQSRALLAASIRRVEHDWAWANRCDCHCWEKDRCHVWQAQEAARHVAGGRPRW